MYDHKKAIKFEITAIIPGNIEPLHIISVRHDIKYQMNSCDVP